MKHWIAILVVIAVVIIVSALLIEEVLDDPIGAAARRWLAEPGYVAAIAVVVVLGVDVFVPIPSSLVMILSGALFGVGGGALLSLVGSLSGNLLGFELSRRYGAALAAAARRRAAARKHGGRVRALRRPLRSSCRVPSR